jgi:lysophospholipase L1-like esterase
MSRWLLRFLLVAAGVSVGLALCELFLRIQEPYLHVMRGKNRTSEYLMIASPTWHHWPKPNATLALSTEDTVRYPRPIVYSTNRFGCRYPRELAVPKPRNVKRILVLGDSFTEGYYYEDTIAAQLESRLNATAIGVRYEVVNCGCTSYSPLLEYLRLRHQLMNLDPDEVILNVDLTDVFDDYWRYRPRCVFAPDGELLAVKGEVGMLYRLLVRARYKFYTMRLISAVRASLLTRLETSEERRQRGYYSPENVFAYYSTMPADSPEWQQQVGFLLENLTRIIDFCRQRHLVLTVTMYPYKQQLKADASGRVWNREFEYRVQRLCNAHGVDFYSAFDGIARAFHAGKPVYWDNDIHFTPTGQRIWAELVCDFFLSREGSRAVRDGVD